MKLEAGEYVDSPGHNAADVAALWCAAARYTPSDIIKKGVKHLRITSSVSAPPWRLDLTPRHCGGRIVSGKQISEERVKGLSTGYETCPTRYESRIMAEEIIASRALIRQLRALLDRRTDGENMDLYVEFGVELKAHDSKAK